MYNNSIRVRLMGQGLEGRISLRIDAGKFLIDGDHGVGLSELTGILGVEVTANAVYIDTQQGWPVQVALALTASQDTSDPPRLSLSGIPADGSVLSYLSWGLWNEGDLSSGSFTLTGFGEQQW